MQMQRLCTDCSKDNVLVVKFDGAQKISTTPVANVSTRGLAFLTGSAVGFLITSVAWLSFMAFYPGGEVAPAAGSVRRDWTISLKGALPDRDNISLICDVKGKK